MIRLAGGPAPALETPCGGTAATRSRMYALLGESLSFPQGAVLERQRSRVLEAELQAVAARLPVALAVPAPAGGVADATGDALATTYTRLFHACGTRPAVSMLEHRYCADDGPPQPLWEDLLRFYRHFGLDFAQAGLRESPDHLLVELDFMHYLTYLEAGAAAGGADLRRAQRDFLCAHPARWVGDFATALARHAPAARYTAAADLLAAFVSADLGHLWDEPATD